MSLITDLKNKIKDHLDALKTATTLGTVIVDDFKTPPGGLFKNIANYPAAILGTPAIESDYETNRDNLRTHVFEILVVQKAENVASATAIEDLIETVLNRFDDDPTLGSKAVGGVLAATAAEQVTTADGSFIYFVVTIRARGIYTRA